MAQALKLSRATFYHRLNMADEMVGFLAKYDGDQACFLIMEGRFGPRLKRSPQEIERLDGGSLRRETDRR